MVEFIINHAVDIMAILWVLDQVAAMTPEDFKIGKFPVGKYDNVIVSLLKGLINKVAGTKKKEE